jgi:aminopeptidase-like protein
LLAGLVYVVAGQVAWVLSAQNVKFDMGDLSAEVIERRLRRLHAKDAEREGELKALFREAGCAAERITEQAVSRKGPPNLICTLPGSTDSLIIVSAHFDHVPEGDGAVDDWSGASLLPSIYEALKVQERRHTIEFVGFTDEEKGLVGSQFYVKHLAKDRLSAVKAVVNLECLGLAPSEVWAFAANQDLLADLSTLARAVHAPISPVDVQKVGNDDTQAFRDKKIPTITFHSVTQQTLSVLHTRKDNLSAVNLSYLYDSYRLVTQYVGFIDQVLE